MPDGSILTITSSKKKKYCYVEGVGDEKKILATLPLGGGVVYYHITNFGGSYDLTTQASHIPWNYRYMEQAVINWIVDEYNKVKIILYTHVIAGLHENDFIMAAKIDHSITQ